MELYASSQRHHVWVPHFRHRQRVLNINYCTKAYLADIHFIYDYYLAEMDVLLFSWMEKVIHVAAIESLNVRSGASEPGRFHSFMTTIEGSGRHRAARTRKIEEGVLHAVDRNPSTSVWALAVATGRSWATFHRVLQGEALRLFNVERLQLLQPDIHPRHVADMHFTTSVLFCDEATFYLKKANFHSHMWALNNLQSTRPRAAQKKLHC